MKNKEEGETLESYLNQKVFFKEKGVEIVPDKKDINGFQQFMKKYKVGLYIERAAVEFLKCN